MTLPIVRRLVALTALAVLPACGGGVTPPPPPPTPTPVPLAPFVIFQSAFPPLEPDFFAWGDFTIATPGVVRATMDWTFPSNQMYLFVFSGTGCTAADFNRFLDNGTSNVCVLLGQDIDPSTKPAVITFNATAPGGARVFVFNTGPTGESGTILITLAR